MDSVCRTFVTVSAIATHSAETATPVSLYDSSGTLLDCNWCRVQAVDHDADGYFGVGVSSVGTNVHEVSGGGSAIAGAIGGQDVRGIPTAELFVMDQDRFNQIQIWHSELGQSNRFIVTYGYRVPVNPLRGTIRGLGD